MCKSGPTNGSWVSKRLTACIDIDSEFIISSLWTLISPRYSLAEDGYCLNERGYPSLSKHNADTYTTWGCMHLSHLRRPLSGHSQHIKNSFSFWLVRRSLLTMHLQVSTVRVRVTPSLMHTDTRSRKLQRRWKDAEMQNHCISRQIFVFQFDTSITMWTVSACTLYMFIIPIIPLWCHFQIVVT